MEEFLFVILQIVLEVFGEIVLGGLMEVLTSIYQHVFHRSNRSAVAACCGLLVAGAALGGLSLLARPNRTLASIPRTGLSLILVPLCVGWALQKWGDARSRCGHSTSSLATFGGGAAFAFGLALARLIGAR